MSSRIVLLIGFSVVASLLITGQGGMKGTPIPLMNLMLIIAASGAAAFVCRRLWRAWIAPFVGGLAGAILAGPLASPYGGMLGIFVGAMVAVMPFATKTRDDSSAAQIAEK